MTLTGPDTPVLAVVIEAQLSRDDRKQWSWPVYLATLRARLKCPTLLLVVCVEATIAAWCAAPIDLGHPGWTLTPLVVGPDRVPLVDDPDQVRKSPGLALLSAMTRINQPGLDKAVQSLLDGILTFDDPTWSDYADIVFATLGEATQRYLEARMTAGTFEYRSDFARRWVAVGQAQGEAKGEANAILTVLAERGVHMPDDVRERIAQCDDIEQLSVWLKRAVTVDAVEELFD